MTAGYQSAHAAQSATAWQTRAGEGTSTDLRCVRFPWLATGHDIAISRRGCARNYSSTMPSRKQRGRRESRVPSAPAVMRKNAHDGPQVRRNTRPSLRSGFNGLWRALPGDEFVLPPSLTDWRSIEARSGSTLSISLTPATGAGTTRFCRPQLPSRGAPTGLMCCRPTFPARAFKRRSSARHSIAHKPKLTLRTHRAPTLPRPPQPAPTFVTTADAPLAGQDGGILLLICPTG